MKLAVTALVFAGAQGQALSQTISEEVTPKVVGIDGADLFQARHVLKRFFETEKHPECYRIIFSRAKDGLRVDLWPMDRDPLVLKEGDVPPAAKPPCGRNIGYILDRRGAVVRHVYSR